MISPRIDNIKHEMVRMCWDDDLIKDAFRFGPLRIQLADIFDDTFGLMKDLAENGYSVSLICGELCYVNGLLQDLDPDVLDNMLGVGTQFIRDFIAVREYVGVSI